MTVLPSTTCELSERPLKAATVRVVRLFAAAIDHSVSPGLTTWGTAAPAVEGARIVIANSTAQVKVRRKAVPPCVGSVATEACPSWGRCQAPRAGLRDPATAHAARRSQALPPEMALVRAFVAAVEPCAGPSRVRTPTRLLSLARARQRARDAAGRTPRARRACAAGAARLAHRAGPRPDPDRRRHVPQSVRDGGRRPAGRDRRPLHVRQRLLHHRRQPPLRRRGEAGPVAGLHEQGADAGRR